MEWLSIIVMLTIACLVSWYFFSGHDSLEPGQLAPDFKLTDQNGNLQRLADFRGKWLALYFYPKDGTPGCTRQACAFRDDLSKLKALDAEVVGISVDTINSHVNFAQKFGLQFPLLADTAAETATHYHSLLNLGIVKFAKRNTFLIDPFGRIAKVYLSANARHNSSEIVSDLKRLKDMNNLYL
ncbi:MAG: peroxiredoxin [Burkholderiales bacterium]|nr:peroxiredoxin [Nitrosomonas sp.]MCP5274747.1 peroxiredoxin [Burkholderiales bacterium]